MPHSAGGRSHPGGRQNAVSSGRAAGRGPFLRRQEGKIWAMCPFFARARLQRFPFPAPRDRELWLQNQKNVVYYDVINCIFMPVRRLKAGGTGG